MASRLHPPARAADGERRAGSMTAGLPLPCQCHHRAIRPSLPAQASAARLPRPAGAAAEPGHHCAPGSGLLRLPTPAHRRRDVRVSGLEARHSCRERVSAEICCAGLQPQAAQHPQGGPGPRWACEVRPWPPAAARQRACGVVTCRLPAAGTRRCSFSGPTCQTTAGERPRCPVGRLLPLGAPRPHSSLPLGMWSWPSSTPSSSGRRQRT